LIAFGSGFIIISSLSILSEKASKKSRRVLKREVNPRLNYKKSTMQIISELSKTIGIPKKFIDMTRDDALSYLDKCRKLENQVQYAKANMKLMLTY